nr:hypothetical protein [Kitasatospora sp. SID7827]
MVYTDGDVADRPRTVSPAGPADLGRTTTMLRRLLPGCAIELMGPASLAEGMWPPFGRVCAGSFPGIDVICAQRLVGERPSALPVRLIAASAGRRLVAHSMHSVVDWSAFGVWEDRRLVRSLSLCPDEGIIEDIGEPLLFEVPYQEADRAVVGDSWPDRAEDPNALPFHALALGADALRALCRINLTGPPGPTDIDTAAVGLHDFLMRGPITD